MKVHAMLGAVDLSTVIDIAFMSLLLYIVLVWFKRTRAAFVLTGIIIIGLVYLLARQFGLYLTASVLQGFFAVILVAVVVIFQEELRRFFERVAVWSLNRNLPWRAHIRAPRREVEILVRTATSLARERIGALIVVRGKEPLGRHLDGGVDLNGQMSEALLQSLFEPHSFGHDGAAIIEDGRVTQFSCHLPLSKNFQKLQRTGTRHAAALGLSELTDALCLVVSEEQGTISVARHGDLVVMREPQQLTTVMNGFYQEIAPASEARVWPDFFRKNSREKIVAVVMAMALWFVLVHESRWEQRTYRIPVEAANLPAGLSVDAIDPSEVTVVLSGARRSFYLVDERRIGVVLRLFDARPGVLAMSISSSDLSIPKELTLERVEPPYVTLRVTPLAE